MRFSQKHIIKFIHIKRTWLSFKIKLLLIKGTLLSLLTILCHIPKNDLSFQRQTYLFLTKPFHDSYPFQRMWLSFKVKLLQRKGTLFSLLTIHWHIQIKNFYFQSNKCAFHKSISWNSYHFKRSWLSSKVKPLQINPTLFSLLRICWHIHIRYFSFPRNECTFFTKAYHEILTH